LLSKFETRTGTFKSSRKNKRDWNGSCFHENFGNHRELAGKLWCLVHTLRRKITSVLPFSTHHTLANNATIIIIVKYHFKMWITSLH
jgi:hypothetical protein